MRWAFLGLFAGALALPCAVFAQAAPPAEEGSDELGEPDEPAPGPGNIPAEPQSSTTPPSAGPQLPPTPPAPTAPPPAPPSPFTLTVKGLISGSVFLQDVAFNGSTGGAAIFSPAAATTDKWFWGGDIRQSRLNFSIKAPPVFGGAIPNGVMEIDLTGGHQITSVPNTAVPVSISNMGMAVGSTTVNVPQGIYYGDEALLPKVRVAYAELSWGGGLDIVRVGQFHNLLLPMIAASAIHIGTPLGYGAGQLGWRSPGITYLHRQPIGEDTFLDLGAQINRNSWVDNLPTCSAVVSAPACLPQGISYGEASMLPQVEARVMLSGGKAPSPWLYYAPNVWQVHAIGHWDQKDLSGIGPSATPGVRDTLTTLLGEFGFKLHLGPVLVAGNAYYGKNSANVFGNLIQFQLPTMARPNVGDVNAFGGWAQVGFNITENLTIWGFAGIDKPNKDEAISEGFTRLQNIQLNGMIAWADGPMIVAAELFVVATDVYSAADMTTTTNRGMQPSVTLLYNF